MKSRTSNNSSKRNYGNRVDGPWVFGMVLEKISDVETRETIKAELQKQKRYFIREIYPNDKQKRKQLYKDNRKFSKQFQRQFESARLKHLLDKAKKTKQEFRMFIVQRRDAKTLIPLIKNNIRPDSDIHSDEWRAYSKIKPNGYSHYTVNHKENFVNPETGKHTQLVECLWCVNKKQIPNRIRGKSVNILQLYLAQQWWKSVNGNDGPNLFIKVLKILKQVDYNFVLKKIKGNKILQDNIKKTKKKRVD